MLLWDSCPPVVSGPQDVSSPVSAYLFSCAAPRLNPATLSTPPPDEAVLGVPAEELNPRQVGTPEDTPPPLPLREVA